MDDNKALVDWVFALRAALYEIKHTAGSIEGSDRWVRGEVERIATEALEGRRN